MQCKASVALLLAVGPCLALALNIPPVQWPPEGFKADKVPQFILFSHDDGISDWETGLVLPIAASARNPDGCHIPVTWFGCTRSCPFDCDQVRRVYRMGHEVAAHTQTHPDLRGMGTDQIRREITGSRADIARCGVPLGDVEGFRCPFLSDKPEVRQVLAEAGFRYDSTIGAESGSRRRWPGTMDEGVGFDCEVAGQECSRSERHPGLWEVPLYEAPDYNLMDYCTDEESGDPRGGCSPENQLKNMFDAAYNGNRGPVTVAIHSPYLEAKGGQYAKQLKSFFKYALGKEDVWAVTMSQLLDWMERPVPANKMARFMAQYPCDR